MTHVDPSEIHDVVVVGAGVAGLTLARELRARGLEPVVLDRSRGVGGRCATRRVDGQPVDHGLAFLHGRAPRFLARVAEAAEGAVIRDWPSRRDGDGPPCQPQAFSGRDERVAFPDGVSRFAKFLARGLDVRLKTNVVELRSALPSGDGGLHLALEGGGIVRARAVALTLPVPSVVRLLRRMTPVPAAVAALLPILDLVRMVPCLTVIARYPEGTPAPAWEASFPGTSAAIQTILHDSSKREGSPRLVLVIQARAPYSRARLDEPVESWTQALLAEAAALHGPWMARPELVQSHIWRNARVSDGCELAGPVATRLDGGVVLGIAGDGLHDAGGVEGAYLSGIALAARFTEMLGAK